MYSKIVQEHFTNPQNAYEMLDADAEGSAGDPACGDALMFFIKVRENIITEISYLVFGCCASIATSSMTSVMAKGKSLEEAAQITEEDIIKALDGLPENKVHCSNLGIGALRKAIYNYWKKAKMIRNIVIIGTDPKCPRCELIFDVMTKKNVEMGIDANIYHLSYLSDEVKNYAQASGLVFGTAKDVARLAAMEIDNEKITDVIDNFETDVTCEFNQYNNCKWSMELDNLLKPYEEKAKEIGVVMTPVIIINDEIKYQGSVPTISQIDEWLLELKKSNKEE